MGAVKHHAMELEQAAMAALFQAKALLPCEVHSDEYYRPNDPDCERHAYALATIHWKRGQVGGEREELMDAVKRALEYAADDECPYCAHLADQD
jgi:hypothetical protein